MKTTATGIPRKWLRYYRALLAQRDVLSREHAAHDAELRELNEDEITDVADRASEEQEREELRAELYVEEGELTEIDAALERIRAGTYGICEITGKPIPEERLEVVPWTRYSHDAAVKHERQPL